MTKWYEVDMNNSKNRAMYEKDMLKDLAKLYKENEIKVPSKITISLYDSVKITFDGIKIKRSKIK